MAVLVYRYPVRGGSLEANAMAVPVSLSRVRGGSFGCAFKLQCALAAVRRSGPHSTDCRVCRDRAGLWLHAGEGIYKNTYGRGATG